MIVFFYYYVNTIYIEIHEIFENSVHLSGLADFSHYLKSGIILLF